MGVVASRGGRWSLLLVLAVAAFVGLALEGSWSSADDSATTQAAPALAVGRLDDLLSGARSVASMATDSSQTFRRPDGSFVTRVFAQPEADDVQAAGDGFRTTSDNGWTTRLPDDLSSPIWVTKASSWVSMRLRGGAGAATHDASSVTYENALDGVDVEYQSTAAGLGELIHLSGASAPSRLTFDLDASDGLHPVRHDNGVIDVVDADGDRALALRPSYAFADSDPTRRQAVNTTLTQVDGGWRLGLSVDSTWLAQALASGPVTIDPTVELDGAAADCPLTTDVASTSYCGNARLWVGYAGPGDDDHAMVRWDLSSIPATAAVLAGDVGLYQSDTGPNLVKRLDMHRVTRAWTSGASWNTYDGTHAWTAAGGDFDPTPISSAQVPAHHTGWVDWDGTKLVQQWITGGLANNGVLFKDQSGPAGPAGEEDFFSTSGTIPSQRPELDVLWQARTGAVDSYTFEHQGLDAKTNADVNVANGNLLLSSQGISAAGTGLNLELDNYHNSLADPATLGAEGIRGTASLGRDVRLVPATVGTVAFYRGDGYAGTFTAPQTTGSTTSYTAPLELPGVTLSLNTSTHVYSLVLPAGLPSLPGQPLTLTFASTGKLTKVADAAGHAITLGYYSANSSSGLPPLGSILDTNSASWDVDSNYTPDGYIDQITRPGGTTWNWTYGHLNGDYLTQFTAGDTGQAWHYDYDTSHRLSTITTPDAKVTKITYSGTTFKVASIINTNNPAHTTGPTTTYTYSSPTSPCQSTNFDYAKTVVSRPDSSTTTYCANNYAQVTYDTDNPTAATPSGEWYDLHDGYTQGTGTHSITTSGADAGSGVKKVSLERGDNTPVAASTGPCDPRNAPNPTACPHTSTATATFDPSTIPEGAQTFHVRTTDYAGNSVVSPNWTVNIDRTAPPAPSAFIASFAPDDQAAAVAWNPTPDPALPSGGQGSGFANASYRYQVGSGAYSAWSTTSGNSIEVDGVTSAATPITVQVQTRDAVGNASIITTATVTAGSSGAEDADLQMASAISYQQDFGGTIADALSWMVTIDHTDDLAPDVDVPGQALGIQFMWIDNGAKRIEVAVDASADRSAIHSRLAADGVDAISDIVDAISTPSALDAAEASLSPDLDDLVEAGLIQIYQDPAVGVGVDVAAPATPVQEQRVRDAVAALNVPTSVQRTSSQDYRFTADSCARVGTAGSTVAACDPPLRGGTGITDFNGGCSLGFNVYNPTNNNIYAMTAGHCFDAVGDTWVFIHSDDSAGDLGPVTKKVFGHAGDYGFIHITAAAARPTNWVYVPSGRSTTHDPHYAINGAAYAGKPGVPQCVIGGRTGTHCGTLARRKVRLGEHEPGGPTVYVNDLGLIKGSGMCGILPGDSGSPVLKHHTAYGVLSGSGGCLATYQNILDALKPDLKILTD